MDRKLKLILALQQIENVYNLLQEGEYVAFFSSHLLPIKYEIQRQLTNINHSTKIKE